VGLVILAATLGRDAVLVLRGRGDYRGMLGLIKAAEGQQADVIAATSDHDFRNGLLVAYHQEGIPGPPVRLFGDGDLPATGAAWYLLYDTDHGGSAADMVADAHGNRYFPFATTRGGGVAATHWHLFRRERRTEP
jgi:hypothetical protein